MNSDLIASSTDRSPLDPNESSELYQKIKAKEFLVTAELAPPKQPLLNKITDKLHHFDCGVSGINLLDMASANLRMSSLGAAISVVNAGFEPIMQMTCRDRNRLAMQADLIAGYAHGVRNILCLTGDFVTFGDHPSAKPVYGMDSTNLIMMVNQLRTTGNMYSGEPLVDSKKEEAFKMQWCIGGAANPYGNPPHHLASVVARKVAAGADFIQTQPIFDLALFDEWWKALEDQGLTDKVAIIPGILPARSARGLEFMRDNVPGIWVPQAVDDRVKGADDQKAEGLKIARETMLELKEKYPIAGFHLYPLSWPEILKPLLEEAGLLDSLITSTPDAN